MRLTYDAQADALSLVFRDGLVASSREIVRGVIVNLDERGDAVGIEREAEYFEIAKRRIEAGKAKP